MSELLRPIDTAHHPCPSGVFAPVDDEIEAADLPVIGRIPDDPRGVYLRNGPNPIFSPLGSYTYPLDGDGMIHGIWFADGRARYRNRYVLSKGLAAEIRAGRALWGGLMTPATPPASLAGPDKDPEDYKLLPGINIVRHAHRFLALGEGTAPYEVSEAFATVGRHDFAGGLPLGMCAHPKIDPASGEMFLFRYGLEEPYLYWAAVGPDGRVSRPPEVIAEIDRGHMIHDSMVTEDYLVLVINPATFALARAARGASPLAWEADRGTRIAIIPRNGRDEKLRWVETDAFWCWHYANAWQEGGEIVTCFPQWSHLSFGVPGAPPSLDHFVRARVDPATGGFRVEILDERLTEFPRVDDRRLGRPTRYVMVSHRTSAALRAGGFDDFPLRSFARNDVGAPFRGSRDRRAVFAPKPGPDPVDLSNFVVGEKRINVLAEVGSPIASTKDGEHSCDIYKLYTRGPGAVGKGALAAGEAVADVFTLGLSKVLFTPAEAATRNSKHTVLFCYTPDEKLLSVKESDARLDD